MRVLITGSSGFLGSWFLNHFLTDRMGLGDDVWYVDIAPHPTGIPTDRVDLEEWLSDFDQQIDVVFHFAAPVGGRMKIEHDPMYNADAFRLDSVMYRWAATHADTVVYPSSSAIYPISLQGRHNPMLLHEGFIDARNPSWSLPDELYGFSKLAGELMGVKAVLTRGINVLAIRPFSGYGPGQSLDYPVPSILARASRHEDPLVIWGPGDQTRDFVYVGDIVGATMARLEAGVDGFQTMNISTGIGTTFVQIAKNAAAIAGYNPEIRADEGKPSGVMHRRGDPQRMERYYQPRMPLLNGLRATYEWLTAPEPVAADA